MKAKGSLITQEVEVEANLKEISEFFGDITPDFIKECGGILSDKVRFWRWQKQVEMIKSKFL